jgi:hypothetical protein
VNQNYKMLLWQFCSVLGGSIIGGVVSRLLAGNWDGGWVSGAAMGFLGAVTYAIRKPKIS